MNADTNTKERSGVQALPRQPGTKPVEEVVDQVRQDSRRNPEEFLDETVVPHGGE